MTRRNWRRSVPDPIPSLSDFSAWGGFCRIHVTPANNINAVDATDMHSVCRFCLLAIDHPDAVKRLTMAGVTDFAFLTRSESATEINLTHDRHGILDSPLNRVCVYVAHPSVCYMSPESYTLFVRADAPTPESVSSSGIPRDIGAGAGMVVGVDTLRTRGFLERLGSSIGSLLSKPGDRG